MKKFQKMLVLSAFLLVGLNGVACAEFAVNWGISGDDASGEFGYQKIAQYLVLAGYQPTQAAAELFVQNSYIGHNAGDADPFHFLPSTTTSLLIQRIGDLAPFLSFGAYDAGDPNSKTLIFNSSDPVGSSTTTTLTGSHGFYLDRVGAPGFSDKTWYTDRALNVAGQAGGSPFNEGGDPQGLIYDLGFKSNGEHEYLLSWEDLSAASANSDRDYNDYMVKITVTPEPVSSTLFLLGGSVLAAGLRRKKKVA